MRLYEVIRDEITDIRNRFGDERKTAILHDPGEILTEDLIDEEETVITLSDLNYIKRMSLDTYRSQNRGGRGVMGMQTRSEDVVRDLIIANTHDFILFFTDKGKVYQIKAYEIPEAGRNAKGLAIINLLNLTPGEGIAAIIPIGKDEISGESFLTMVTKKGIVKKTDINLYSNRRKNGLTALNIRDDDALIAVLKSDGNKSIILAASSGKGIRFKESDVRPTGRTASGVKAITLQENERVVGADVLDENARVLVVSSGGFGKCIKGDSLRIQARGGKGLIIYKPSEKVGEMVGVANVSENNDLMLINSEGIIIRIPIADISMQGRMAKGVKLIQMDKGVSVVSMAKIVDVEEEDNE
jgi:DNA gyrase subunit A